MTEPGDRAVLLLQKVSELLLESRAIVQQLEVVPDRESSADAADRIAYGILVAGPEEGLVNTIRHALFATGTIPIRQDRAGDGRWVTMNSTAREALLAVKREQKILSTYVFSSPEGKFFHNFERYWRPALRTAKIPDFRFHDLSHTFASRLAMAGVGPIHRSAGGWLEDPGHGPALRSCSPCSGACSPSPRPPRPNVGGYRERSNSRRTRTSSANSCAVSRLAFYRPRAFYSRTTACLSRSNE